jgi:hypothetical protein
VSGCFTKSYNTNFGSYSHFKEIGPSLSFSLSLPQVVTLYQESPGAPIRPANAQRRDHVESPLLRAYSVRVTCIQRNSHQNMHLPSLSPLQMKQLQLGKEYTNPTCQCMRTTPATVASRRPPVRASRAEKRYHGTNQRSAYPTPYPVVPPPLRNAIFSSPL